ncbi:hypothetical protein J3D55_001277 [Chryseobacterium ginsenosidimutans]|nr:hypothetical protein [Chryseobacterium ginsenosidimutans]
MVITFLLLQNYYVSAHSFYAVEIYFKNQVTIYKSFECYSNWKFDDETLKVTTLIYKTEQYSEKTLCQLEVEGFLFLRHRLFFSHCEEGNDEAICK